ncbi:uncharacterized protein LOC116193070 [Punica granatum]|uniref:Uncharacterized protein n=2 Tax=Punica granatum TaxID=22663 RepID=A0A218X7J2_PUNGR|nr:uncharacterized protein LOC116193070 [Punica granatum]OWM80937.1 hypothetical protein CDL15_Pgr006968 [Punica granatum]PKI45635.1 hypothetical protein CRG98_033951 [Punica granatum]
MEPTVAVFDGLKGFAKSTQDFVSGLIHHHDPSSSRNNPIEILKRLQREAFSDLMRLRDRQDKIERLLSIYKTSNKGPFEEAGTRVRGEVDVSGAVLKMDTVDQQNFDALRRAGIRTGVNARFTFETQIRGKDYFVAELMASQKAAEDFTDFSGNLPLSLSKVFYKANITDWFSAAAIPIGAHCRDIGNDSSSSRQGKGLTDNSSLGPPLVSQPPGSAFGVTARKANFMATLGHLVSGLEMPLDPHGIRHIFSTFGQVVCDLPREMKLSIVGVHQIPIISDQRLSLGPFAIPLSPLKRRQDSDVSVISTPGASSGSIAVMLESQLDEDTRIGGWVEMKSSDNKNMKWAIAVSDDSEDEFGWGLCLSGATEGSNRLNRFQVESYLKFNVGKRFTVKPGLVHVMDGSSRITALLVRSNWSL